MRLFLLALLLFIAPVTVAHAGQAEAPPATTDSQALAPPHIAAAEGRATLEREGRADEATSGMPIVAGDRLRTEEGRLEIVLGDGSGLFLDRRSTVDWQSDALIRLIDGRILLIVATIEEGTKFIPYRIDTVGGIVQVNAPGEYRMTTLQSSGGYNVELAVLRGAAELTNDLGRMAVHAGQRSFVRAGAPPSYAQPFNSAMWDAFDRWAADRRQARAGITSPRYLPPELYSYSGVFDRYGTWRQEPTYGYVWYPYAAAGWRPYVQGHWNYLDPYGWTWIASDPWGWPTHHYGRWGMRGSAWFWIPARRWGPAWVHWAVAPGYVAWCPLGFDNRPLVSINIFNRGDRYRVSPGYYGARGVYDPWYAWNVVPFDRFRARRPLRSDFVDGRLLAHDVRSRFVMQGVAPLNREPSSRAGAVTGVAVPRGTAPALGPRGVAPGVIRGEQRADQGPVAVPRAVPRSVEPGRMGRPQGSERPSSMPQGFRRRDLGPGGPVPTPSEGTPAGSAVPRAVPVPERRSGSPAENVPDRYRGDRRAAEPGEGYRRRAPAAEASPESVRPVPPSGPESGAGYAVPRTRDRGGDSYHPPAPESPRVHRPRGADDGGGYRGRPSGGEARPRGAERSAPPPQAAPPPNSTPSGGAERSRAVPRGGSRRP
jgi:hypothetical protein